MRLDRSRPFGLSYPSGRLVQDDCEFDPETGEVLDPIAEPVSLPQKAEAIEVVEETEARRIDLRKKENAHMRPAFKMREKAKAA